MNFLLFIWPFLNKNSYQSIILLLYILLLIYDKLLLINAHLSAICLSKLKYWRPKFNVWLVISKQHTALCIIKYFRKQYIITDKVIEHIMFSYILACPLIKTYSCNSKLKYKVWVNVLSGHTLRIELYRHKYNWFKVLKEKGIQKQNH